MNDSPAARIEEANTAILVDGDLDAVERFFADGYVVHMTESDMQGGPDTVRGFASMLHRGFSDVGVEVEILVEAEDRVAWQRTVRATHDGPFQAFPATGREIVWRDMITSRFRDGLITEEWVVSDLAERLLRSRKG